MLSIGKVGPANAGYYQSAVVAGVEDYYAGDGDAPGVWIGRADLVGAVAASLATAVDSKMLLEAKCAPDGTRLGKTTVSERSVTAFDLTFSAPKSVSVLYALGDERVAAEIEAAHAVAVEEAIKSMSPRIAFTRTGRGRGGCVRDPVSASHEPGTRPPASRSCSDLERCADGVGRRVAHPRCAWSVSRGESCRHRVSDAPAW